ncbi:hypothetical protein DFP73DRAFT_539763 [Morchella snyderi]|nr:hypothetical protein DFP73DRAFT_539763 [Morchella snyderi]
MPPILPARIAYDVDFIQSKDSADKSAERLAKSRDSRPPVSPRAAALGADGWWDDSHDDESLGEDFILLNSHLRDPTDRNRNRSSVSSRRGHRTLPTDVHQPSWLNYAYHQTPAVAPVGYQPPPRWTRRAIHVEEPGVEGMTELRIPGEDGALVDDGFGNFGYPRYKTPPPRSPLPYRSSLQDPSLTQTQRYPTTRHQESRQDSDPPEDGGSEGVPESSYKAVLSSWLPWKAAGFACPEDEGYKPLGTNVLTPDESAAIVKIKTEKILFAQKQELEKWNRQRAYEKMRNRPQSSREETELTSSQEEEDELVFENSSDGDGVGECDADFSGPQNPSRPTGPGRPNARYGFRRQANIEAPKYREAQNVYIENSGPPVPKADKPVANTDDDGWRAWTIPEIMGEYFDMTIAAVGRKKPKGVKPMTEDEKEQAKVDSIITSYMKAAEEHRMNPGRPIKELNKSPTTEQWIRNALYSPRLPQGARKVLLDSKSHVKMSLDNPARSHAVFSGHSPLNHTAALERVNRPERLGFDAWTAELNRRQKETDTQRQRWLVYAIFILLFAAIIPLWHGITHIREEGVQEWYSRPEEEGCVEPRQSIARFVDKWEEDVGESYVQWYDGSEDKAPMDPDVSG